MTNEDETEHGQESRGSTWQTLARLFNNESAFFERILFLRGYEFSSNIYAITGDYLTVVEPGNDYTAFLELWELGFKPEAIKKVVLSHGHLDNATGFFELLRSYPPPREGERFELILHEAGPRQIKEAARAFGCPVREVRGGESIELSGTEWQVIHTPGHTVDSICLYHASTGTVFTGDTVLPHAMAEPDGAAGGRLDYYLLAVKELLKRDIRNLLPGHGLPVGATGKRVVEGTYESLLMKIIGADEKTPWMAGARALVERGLLEEAIYCCDKQLAHASPDFQALQLKALCLNDLGRFEEALGVLDHVEKFAPQHRDDVYPLMTRGYALMGLGRYPESLQLFDRALERQPGMKDALVYKAMALYLAGKHEEALAIEPFRTEFVRRFQDELAKQKRAHP